VSVAQPAYAQAYPQAYPAAQAQAYPAQAYPVQTTTTQTVQYPVRGAHAAVVAAEPAYVYACVGGGEGVRMFVRLLWGGGLTECPPSSRGDRRVVVSAAYTSSRETEVSDGTRPATLSV
jgi:hypothetical protein